MDMYPKYTSPFGYQTGVGGIDTYGVNHNGFSLRDEIEYQSARQQRVFTVAFVFYTHQFSQILSIVTCQTLFIKV